MRRLAAFIIGLFCAFSMSAAAAPPPPPPPPPTELPEHLDGYSSSAIWSSYSLWVMSRLGEARAMAFEQRPTRLSEDYYRGVAGPRVRAYNNERGGEMFGADMRLERWCSYSPGQPSECMWLARRSRNRNDGEQREFVRTHFDLERAVAFLRDAGVAPEDVDAWVPSSYGLPDPLAYGIERYLEISEVSEQECPAVAEAVARADEIMRRMSTTAERPNEELPRPPPPHAGLVELTLPGWYARGSGQPLWSGANLVVYGAGSDSIATALARQIFGGIEQCPQMRGS